MAVEVGSIVEGKITGVKKFGAFVSLPDGETGMVHISEVSNGFIEELSDVLTEGEIVKVKILSKGEDGKIALSIKRTVEAPPRTGGGGGSGGPRAPRPARPQRADSGRVWQPRQSNLPQGDLSFEDMMSQFKTKSEEKISDLRKVTEARRGGGYTRRGH